MALAVEKRFAGIRIVTDFQHVPGDEVPPQINQHQPDLYAHADSGKNLILGEAKTPCDIDTDRSLGQLSAFIKHLESRGAGTLILSVPDHSAGLAKTMLRFLRNQLNVSNIRLEVYDQLDFWALDQTGGRLWRLC